MLTDVHFWNPSLVKENTFSGTVGPFIIFNCDNWKDVVGSWEIESGVSWEHSVFVDLSSRELDWSINPFIDVVMVPWEVDEFVSLQFIDWLS